MLHDSLSSLQAIGQLIPKLVPHEDVLYALARLLLLNLSSISLVGDNGSLKELLEIVSLFLLLFHIV